MTARIPDFYADSPPAVRLALCQTHTEEWDVPGNFARLCADLREAARQGAELAVTPECVLHGYGSAPPEEMPRRLAEVAEPLDGPRVAAVAALARELNLDVVLGFAERGAHGRFHNAAALLPRDSRGGWVYRKVHCRPFERAERGGAFTPGDAFRASERGCAAGRFRVGAMICFDREIPESARCLRALGAELIACPLATPTYDPAAPGVTADNELVTRCRAAENEVFIAVVNHAGRFNGGSYVVGPYGDVLCRLGAGPETRVLEVPLSVLRHKVRRNPYGWMGWGYRRPEVYTRYLPAAESSDPPADRQE